MVGVEASPVAAAAGAVPGGPQRSAGPGAAGAGGRRGRGAGGGPGGRQGGAVPAKPAVVARKERRLKGSWVMSHLRVEKVCAVPRIEGSDPKRSCEHGCPHGPNPSASRDSASP